MSVVSHALLSQADFGAMNSGGRSFSGDQLETSQSKFAQAMEKAQQKLEPPSADRPTSATPPSASEIKPPQNPFTPSVVGDRPPPSVLFQVAPKAEASSAHFPGSSLTQMETGARERAMKTFGFEAPVKAGGSGDSILQGLQNLRRVFDGQTARINGLMSGPNVVDSGTLFKMQVEVVQYTMLIDISSKLVGKTTQSFDTLMKGQ